MCSADSAASMMGGIQSTVAEFHRDCTVWEREFDELLREFSDLPAGPGRGERQLAFEQHDQLVAQQTRMAIDLAELRRLVERQREVFHGGLSDASGTHSAGGHV